MNDPHQETSDKARGRCQHRTTSIAPIADMLPPIVNVLYVLGCSRSGSTVLTSLLGSDQRIVGVGELAMLNGRVGLDAMCACGKDIRSCLFWSAVRNRWQEECGSRSIRDYASLRRKYSRIRHIPRFMIPGEGGSGFRRYSRLTHSFLQAAAEEASATWIVDSSKSPARMLALAKMPRVNLRVIHLVRDPRGVAVSLMRRIERDIAGGVDRDIPSSTARQACRAWNVSNFYSTWSSRMMGEANVCKVRYEDLLSDPVDTLQLIGALIDLDLTKLGRCAAEGKPFDAGHVIAGNRLRMQMNMVLRTSDDWASKIDSGARRTVEKHCRRGMGAWGYVC